MTSAMDLKLNVCFSQIVQPLPAKRHRPVPVSEEFPRGFHIEDLYEFLPEDQRSVLEAAVILTGKFSRGRICHHETLRRVLSLYHGQTKVRRRRAICDLRDLGIVRILPDGGIQLIPSAVDFLTKCQREAVEILLDAQDQLAA